MAGVRTPASLHDVELAALAAAGDRPAFGELVRRHGSAVRGLLRRMGAEPSLADDIAQDAFLAAFERVSEFRGEGTFSAWVRKIAARLFVRRWRKESRFDVEAEDLEDSHGGEVSAAARIDLDGLVFASDAMLATLELAAQVGGRVLRILVPSGAPVRRGGSGLVLRAMP